MPLDLSKLTDAVSKVASLAASHADVSSQVSAITVARDAALADLVSAQADIDALTETLLKAAQTPAEAAGIAAVSQALAVAPEPVVAPVVPAVVPVAPPLPVGPTAPATTFLPGDPRSIA